MAGGRRDDCRDAGALQLYVQEDSPGQTEPLDDCRTLLLVDAHRAGRGPGREKPRAGVSAYVLVLIRHARSVQGGKNISFGFFF